MKNITKYINDSKISKIISESINKVLNEGIDFDPNTKTVSYNPSHEDNVDTSIENNPSLDGNIVSNVEVWSIFKRKKGLRGDGNPLIYALKGEGGWTFKSDDDRNAIEKQFELIAEKFAKTHPIGVTILIPSGNQLNRHIAEVIMSKSKDSHLIEGAISKLTVEEVDEIVLKKDSKFRSFYGDDFDEAYNRLESFFDDMDNERGGMFSRHFVKDREMRNVLTDTFKVSTSRYARKSKYLIDKDILIIDDTIGGGQTIKSACQVMMESYAPKSITVLTLLSKLY